MCVCVCVCVCVGGGGIYNADLGQPILYYNEHFWSCFHFIGTETHKTGVR